MFQLLESGRLFKSTVPTVTWLPGLVTSRINLESLMKSHQLHLNPLYKLVDSGLVNHLWESATPI